VTVTNIGRGRPDAFDEVLADLHPKSERRGSPICAVDGCGQPSSSSQSQTCSREHGKVLAAARSVEAKRVEYEHVRNEALFLLSFGESHLQVAAALGYRGRRIDTLIRRFDRWGDHQLAAAFHTAAYPPWMIEHGWGSGRRAA
jgi:hypothetical protein